MFIIVFIFFNLRYEKNKMDQRLASISSFIHHRSSNVMHPISFHAINVIVSMDDCINDAMWHI